MTRGDLITKVAAKLGLDTTITTTGSELDLMQKWANEAVVRVLLQTACHLTIQTIGLTASQADYPGIPDSTILAIEDVYFAGSNQRLEVVSVPEIIERRRQAASSQTADLPTHVAIEGDLLMVYPTPSANSTITVVGIPRPMPMTNDAHDPASTTYGGIPSEYDLALEYYVLWQAAEYEEIGGGFWRGHSYAPGSAYAGLFDQECANVRKWKKGRAGRRLTPARVGRVVPTTARNDVYPGYGRDR